MKTKEPIDTQFILRFTCLPASYVLVVMADSLGGSRANWHHAKPFTRAPQEPTQDEGTQLHEQSTRGAFGAPPGNKPKNPSQIHREMATNNHQLVPTSSSCSKPSRWRQPPRVTRKPQLERSPRATRCNHSSKCTLDHSQLTWVMNKSRE